MKSSRRQKVLNHFSGLLLFAFIFVNAISAFAGPGRTTYQAKIVKPDGYPLEATSVNFKFTILDPAGSCILYSETYSSVNMSSTSGLISFSLGFGVKTYPASATTFEQVFSNITPSLSCDTGGPANYTPTATDIRKIVMQFHDGSGWQTLPAMSINAVPYAMYANEAAKLNGLTSSDFVQVSTVPTCTASEALRYTGTSFSCVAVGSSVTSSTVVSALGYTPADGASVTTLTSNVSSVSSTVASVSSTVFSVSGTVTSLQNSVAASFAAITSSQWTTSGTNIFYNTGNIGIGTTTPVTKLDVSGGVRIGGESTTCAPALAGTLRYNASNVEYCNGTSWQAFGVSGAGITNFNGSTSGTQSFATGTGGTALAFNTANGVHTLNIPLASAASVTAGLISNADYTIFTNKITSSAASIAQVLGYVPANDAASGTYAQKANNLSDLTNVATARTNLGLGTFATASSIDLGSASATGTLAIARLPSFSGDATIAAASNTIILSDSGVTTGTYTKVTVDSKGRVTSGAQITSSDVNTALGYTPANSATIVSSQWTTSGTTINYMTGNVGIGTSNPVEKFVVNGKVILGGTSTLYTGASSFPSIAADAANASALILNGGSITNTWRIKNANGVLDFLTCADATCGGGNQYMKLSTAGLMTPAAISFGSSMNPGMNQYIFNGNASPVDLFAEPYPFGDNAGSDLYLRAGDASTGSTNKNGGTLRLASGKATGTGSSNIEFRTADSTNVTTKMYINGIGNVGIGTTAPTAKLHLASGTTSVAPLKFTSGTLLTSPQSGTMEYDGANFYLTDSTNTRRAIATGSSAGTVDNVSNINSSSNITLTPTGSVIVSSTTASTNSSTGALIVNGGAGIAGNLNVAGTISGSAKVLATGFRANQGSPDSNDSSTNGYAFGADGDTGMFSPGSGAANGVVAFYSNNSEVMRMTNGNVGIGTTNPAASLNVSGSGIIVEGSSGASYTSGIKFNNTGYKHMSLGMRGSNFVIADTSSLGTQVWPSSVTERMVIDSSGNVGIGTTGPGQKLSVAGSIGAGIAGSVSGSISIFPSNGGSWFHLDNRADNTLRFSHGGSPGTADLMTINSSGNVGIGTTVPLGRLDIKGKGVSYLDGLNLVDNANNAKTSMVHTSGAFYLGIADNASNADAPADFTERIKIYEPTAVATNPIVQLNGNYFTMLQSGNVGIGTTGPNFKLQINGSSVANGNAQTSINAFTANGINIQGNVANSSQDAITYQSGGSGGGAAIAFRRGGGYDTYIDFYTNTAATSAAITRQMTLNNLGFLGIGTSSPVTVLDINQSGGYLRSGTSDGGLEIGSGNDESSYIDFHGNANLAADFVGRIEYKDNLGMQFNVNQNITPSIFIASATGYVGIGTTSPGSRNLTVYSNNPGGYTIISNTNAGAGGQDWRWYSSSTGAPLGADSMCFGTGVCYFSLYTTGNATLAGTLTQSSDARLKRDIASIPYALNAVSKLDGVTYYWKDSTKDPSKQLGLIAQDVEKVFPEAVKTSASGFKSVAYQNLIAPLINAVKEIREWMFKTDERIQNLEEARKQDKAAMDDLKKQNETLKEYLCAKDPSAPICK